MSSIAQLTDGKYTDSLLKHGRIVSFIGSDTPNIETVDILKGIQLAAAGQAYITPGIFSSASDYCRTNF